MTDLVQSVLEWWPSFLGLGVALLLKPIVRAILTFGFDQYAIWKGWSQLPHTKAPFTLAGDLVDFHGPHCHRTHQEWSLSSGGVIGIRLGPLPAVMVTDPTLAKPFFDEPKNFVYKDIQAIYSHQHPSLFTLPSMDYYKAIRKGVAPAFNSSNLRQSFGRLSMLMTSAVDYIGRKGSGQSVDIYTLATRLTMNAISLSIFGADLGDSADAWETRPKYACLFEPAIKWVIDSAPVPFIRYLTFIPAIRRKQAELRALHAEQVRMVQRLRTCNPSLSSLGGHLLALMDPATGKPLTDGQLEAEMATFFFAGYDTSSSAISWTLALLATHSHIQRQVEAELAGLGLLATPEQPWPRALTWQDLGSLDYLRKVIKESQRLFTVAATGTGRMLTKPMRVGRYDLAKGTLIHIPFNPMHRNPSAWDRPEEFSPDRFDVEGADYLQPDASKDAESSAGAHEGVNSSGALAEDAELHGGNLFQEKLSSQPAAGMDRTERSQIRRYMPFSYGQRNCVGQNLANVTMLTFIATICAKFTLALDPEMGGLEGVKECAVVALTLQPKDKMLLQCTSRSGPAAQAPA